MNELTPPEFYQSILCNFSQYRLLLAGDTVSFLTKNDLYGIYGFP